MFQTREITTEEAVCHGRYKALKVWEGSILDLSEFCSGEVSDLLAKGRKATTERIEQLLGLASGIDAPQPGHRTLPGIIGGSPIVGRAMQGHPMSMRRRTRVQAPLAPVTIWMNLSCCGTISRGSVTRYRVLIAAMACAVAKTRPVKLKAFTGLGNSGMVVDIPLDPMDSTGLAAMVDADTYRDEGGIMDTWGNMKRCHVGSPWYMTGAGTVKVLGGDMDRDIVTPRLSDPSMIPYSDQDAIATLEKWSAQVLAGENPWKK